MANKKKPRKVKPTAVIDKTRHSIPKAVVQLSRIARKASARKGNDRISAAGRRADKAAHNPKSATNAAFRKKLRSAGRPSTRVKRKAK